LISVTNDILDDHIGVFLLFFCHIFENWIIVDCILACTCSLADVG